MASLDLQVQDTLPMVRIANITTSLDSPCNETICDPSLAVPHGYEASIHVARRLSMQVLPRQAKL